MADSVFPSYLLEQSILDALVTSVNKIRVHTPKVGADGLCRLKPIGKAFLPSLTLPTFLPLKKLLLPPRAQAWLFQSGQSLEIEEPEPFAVVGVPLCELLEIWYLDQVFADDSTYQKQRVQTLLVGMRCEINPGCRCAQYKIIGSIHQTKVTK